MIQRPARRRAPRRREKHASRRERKSQTRSSPIPSIECLLVGVRPGAWEAREDPTALDAPSSGLLDTRYRHGLIAAAAPLPAEGRHDRKLTSPAPFTARRLRRARLPRAHREVSREADLPITGRSR
jgi:hypothetical protein